MKPSATRILRSASPPTYFPLLSSFLFIGFLNWALIPMYPAMDFKVDWPKLLFKSRPQLSCRDIIHVATSRCCRDINSNLCSLQLMSSDVATSISCRDITLCLCRFQLVALDVATSISCRDISLCLWRFHWFILMSRLQSFVATTASVKSSSSFQTCHSFKAILMSRHQSHVATSTFVATSRCCRDIILLASG